MPVKFSSLVLFFLFLIVDQSFSQSASSDSTFVEKSLANAISKYNTSIKDQSLLFNGVQYKEITEPYQGHPFFESEYVEDGAISYYGESYQNVPMQYDLVRDELIIEHYDQKGYVGLVKLHQNRITSFSLLDHNFIRIKGETGIRDGFYDLLYNGDIKVVAKRKKSISEDLSQQVLTISFPEKNSYYLFKDDKYYSIRNKKSMLKVLEDKRKELNQFAKKPKLDFNLDKENAMVRVAEYYDQITQ